MKMKTGNEAGSEKPISSEIGKIYPSVTEGKRGEYVEAVAFDNFNDVRDMLANLAEGDCKYALVNFERICKRVENLKIR